MKPIPFPIHHHAAMITAFFVTALAGGAGPVAAQEYETQVVALGLHRPTGLVLDENGKLLAVTGSPGGRF